MLSAIAGMALYTVANGAAYLNVCEEGQTTCFSNHYSGDQYTVEWDEVDITGTAATEVVYEVRVIHDDGTIQNLGTTDVPRMTVTTDRSSSHVFQARSVGNCPTECVSGWGGLDDPDNTQDGHSWVIVVKPKPPTASFGN